MYDINKLMESEYRPAVNSRTNNSFKFQLAVLILKVILILIYDSMLWILSLFKVKKLENLSKKLALVTGGGNGLGRSICFRLAREGCDLAIVDIDHKAACRTAKEIEEKYKVTCKPFLCDISNKAAILKLKEDVENQMRGVDILVNNAGLIYVSNFIKCDIEDIDKTVKVNLTAQMVMTRTFLTGMIERKYGRILTVCSVASIVGGPLLTVYSATKRGLDGFVQAFADDLLLSGHDKYIKQTTVYPDFINTRQEVTTILDEIKHFLPRLSPERVADDAVMALINRKEFIHSCDMTLFYYCARLLKSKRAKKFVLSNTVNVKCFYN